MYPVITISREFGTGGHIIGEKVAEKLGVPFYGREIRNAAADRLGLTFEEGRKKSETATAADRFFNMGFANGVMIGDDQDRLFEAQREMIIEYAKQGPCVIVGRCGDAVLKYADIDCLKVFIHADMDFRIEKAKEAYGLGAECDEKYVKKVDKSRKFYHKFYSDEVWGNYENYDLSLNSGVLGEEACVNILIEAAKGFADK